jgi:hypothetical protein
MDENHIRKKCETYRISAPPQAIFIDNRTFQLQTRNICLQQNVDLGSWFVHALLDRYRDALQELLKFQLLLIEG